LKFGCHSFLFTDRWADDRLDFLDTARDLGLQVFEIGIGDDVLFDAALTRRRAQSLGLELAASPGGLWPFDCDLSLENPADREKGLAWHKRQVDLAAELGASAYSGALYGHPGTVRRRSPLPGEMEWTAEGLGRLAEYGRARGVRIVIEPMSHFRTHLVNQPAQALHLLALAAHPNLAILLDTYHMVTEVRDYAAAVREVGARLWGLHACENDRGAPGGGIVPWEEVFQGLREIGFDGYLVLETYNSAIPGFAEGRGMFHNVCPDPVAFIRQGLSFLKQGLAV
jgi:D-psicose/D-tagatose/L-ribulose 3-epimerase